MKTATWRMMGAFLLASVLLAQSGARAATAPPTAEEKAAQTELRTLLKPDPPPKDAAEAMKMLAEALPKVEALAEKNAKNRVGPVALFLTAQIADRVGETEKAQAALQTFVGRYPEHPYKRRAQRMLDQLKTVGSEAKDFTTKTLDAKEVTLSSLRGKVVLLDFFAGWCGPCKAEMPNLLKLYAKYKARGFEIVGVSLDKTLDAAKSYVKKEGITWVVAWEEPGGWKNPVAVKYGVQSIPAMYLLDKQGKVAKLNVRGEALAKALADLLPETTDAK